MRDLYNQLNIPHTASKQEIKKAIESCGTISIVQDAKTALLNEDKKRVFDRCNDSLRQIGKLRANLGLNQGANWIRHNFSDYDYVPTRDESIIEEIINSKPESQRRNDQKKGEASDKSRVNKNRGLSKPMKWFYGLLAITIIWLSIKDINESTNSNVSDIERLIQNDQIKNAQPELTFDKEPSPLPINGYTYNYTFTAKLAPLEIKTPKNSDHYFVVLNDYYSGKKAFTLFIRGGQSVDTTVPLGTYSMKYATGEDWYGEEDLFGPGDMTTRFKTNDRFEFKDEGSHYSGYTLELIRQSGGNMYTEEVSASEW